MLFIGVIDSRRSCVQLFPGRSSKSIAIDLYLGLQINWARRTEGHYGYSIHYETNTVKCSNMSKERHERLNCRFPWCHVKL